MEKYISLLLLLGVALLAGTGAQAQFESGQHFISGNINLGTNRFGDQATIRYTYNHSLGFALGKFTRENRAVGWSLDNSLSIVKLEGYIPDIRPVGSFRMGVGRFIEFYQPLGAKFSLYARPSAGVGYQMQNYFNVSTYSVSTGSRVLTNQTQRQAVSLDINLSAGLLWRFADKWALQGSFAGINPLSLVFSQNSDVYYGLTPNSQPGKVVQNQVGFNLRPDLNTGYVGLGFRYFY